MSTFKMRKPPYMASVADQEAQSRPDVCDTPVFLKSELGA